MTFSLSCFCFLVLVLNCVRWHNAIVGLFFRCQKHLIVNSILASNAIKHPPHEFLLGIPGTVEARNIALPRIFFLHTKIFSSNYNRTFRL